MQVKQLGFQPTVTYRTIFVSKYSEEDRGRYWYFWKDDTKTKDLIPQNSLAFMLERIDKATVIKTFDDGTEEIRPKLDIYVSAGESKYRIRCGFNTWFAKCALLSLGKMNSDELSNVIKITVRLSDKMKHNPKICSLYNSKGDLISLQGSNWKGTDYSLLFEEVKNKIDQAIGSNSSNFVEDEQKKNLDDIPF